MQDSSRCFFSPSRKQVATTLVVLFLLFWGVDANNSSESSTSSSSPVSIRSTVEELPCNVCISPTNNHSLREHFKFDCNFATTSSNDVATLHSQCSTWLCDDCQSTEVIALGARTTASIPFPPSWDNTVIVNSVVIESLNCCSDGAQICLGWNITAAVDGGGGNVSTASAASFPHRCPNDCPANRTGTHCQDLCPACILQNVERWDRPCDSGRLGRGHCLCAHGWTGSVCQTWTAIAGYNNSAAQAISAGEQCPFNRWLDSCALSCPLCNLSNVLNASHPCSDGRDGNGTCLCKPGYGGVSCDDWMEDYVLDPTKPCPANTWGPNCSNICSSTCADDGFSGARCNGGRSGSGICEFGCLSGFTGLFCQEQFPNSIVTCPRNSPTQYFSDWGGVNCMDYCECLLDAPSPNFMCWASTFSENGTTDPPSCYCAFPYDGENCTEIFFDFGSTWSGFPFSSSTIGVGGVLDNSSPGAEGANVQPTEPAGESESVGGLSPLIIAIIVVASVVGLVILLLVVGRCALVQRRRRLAEEEQNRKLDVISAVELGSGKDTTSSDNSEGKMGDREENETTTENSIVNGGGESTTTGNPLSTITIVTSKKTEERRPTDGDDTSPPQTQTSNSSEKSAANTSALLTFSEINIPGANTTLGTGGMVPQIKQSNNEVDSRYDMPRLRKTVPEELIRQQHEPMKSIGGAESMEWENDFPPEASHQPREDRSALKLEGSHMTSDYTPSSNSNNSFGISPSHSISTSGDGNSNKKYQYEQVISGRYRKIKLVGRGAQGGVHSISLENGQLLAMKEIPIPVSDDGPEDEEVNRQLRRIQEEVHIMRAVEHPFILAYLAAVFDPEEHKIFLFTDLCKGGSLGRMVRKLKTALPEESAKLILFQILLGLEYVHRKGIVHRDLKADNVLLGDDGTVRIGDFGCSKMVAQQFTTGGIGLTTAGGGAATMAGTPIFMAPEVLTGLTDDGADIHSGEQTVIQGYGRKADIWSFGIMIGEVMDSGRPPWPHFATSGAAFLHLSNPANTPTPANHIPEPAQDLLRRCCQRNPKDRPSARQLLQHPWFESLRGDTTPSPAANPHLQAALALCGLGGGVGSLSSSWKSETD